MDILHGTNQKCSDYQGVLIFQIRLCTTLRLASYFRNLDYACVMIMHVLLLKVEQNTNVAA